MNGKNIFGVVEDKIVLQLNQDEYILVEYDVKRDQVIFHLGKKKLALKKSKKKNNQYSMVLINTRNFCYTILCK